MSLVRHLLSLTVLGILAMCQQKCFLSSWDYCTRYFCCLGVCCQEYYRDPHSDFQTLASPVGSILNYLAGQ